MKKILIFLIIIMLASYAIYVGLQRRFYQIISQETLVGMVKCANSLDKKYNFYLFYFPAAKEGRTEFKFIKLKGRDWTFEGELIKWKRPLNLIGFKTIHRPIRIYDQAGNCLTLEKPFEKLAFKFKKLLPFVDTNFISAVRQQFVPKIKFGIYATNTGYLLRKIR